MTFFASGHECNWYWASPLAINRKPCKTDKGTVFRYWSAGVTGLPSVKVKSPVLALLPAWKYFLDSSTKKRSPKVLQSR